MNKNELCKEILLMPIHCDKKYESIKLSEDGIILSGQKYRQKYIDEVADPDVSDIAVHFYEIIYKDLFGKYNLSSLLNGCYFRCSEFAGDTMNSFNTTANKTPGAGIKSKERTPKDEWPEYLRNYSERYHCLANFWLLPVEIGRSLDGNLNKARGPINDYMDNFLHMIKTEVKFDKSERCYFRAFDSWEDFVDTHFINGYIKNGAVNMYSTGDVGLCSEKIIENMLSRVEQRAEDIANSKYADEIIELFNKLGLV